MKFILSENQTNLLNKSLEKKSDLIFDIFKTLYPDYENFGYEFNAVSEVYGDNEHLIFMYRWRREEFLVSESFLKTLEGWIGKIYDENNLEYFEKLFKVFAKKHFNWNVEYVGIMYY